MKKIAIIIILLLIACNSFSSEKDIRTVTHFSEALNRDISFSIYIPPDAAAGERFPVLYVLHGVTGDNISWIIRTEVEYLADNYRMILVFPDGDDFGWYIDSDLVKDNQYDKYMHDELVKLVDRLFPTVPLREARGIMGLSMGGHGAMILGAKHPDVYGSASATSGILNLTNHPKSWEISKLLGEYEENKDKWEANSVLHQAERFRDSGVRIMFDCGERDVYTHAIDDNRLMHDRLKELGIPHIWREFTGTHSWSYWDEHLEQHFNFHQAAMVESTPGLNKWRKLYYEKLGEHLEENARLAIAEKDKPGICLLGSSGIQILGDSALDGYKVFNRGIAADGMGFGPRGIRHRMESSVFDMMPDHIFILIGRNGLGDRRRNGEPSIARMMEKYDEILSIIIERLPETKITVINCPPVRDKYAILAEDINSFNKELNIPVKTKDISVIDIHSELVGEKLLIKPEYTTDGLHLSPAANNILIGKMKEALAD